MLTETKSPSQRGNADQGTATEPLLDLSLAHRNLLAADGAAPLHARSYLYGRGFTDEEIKRFGFGLVYGYQDLHQPCLVIPYQGDYQDQFPIRVTKDLYYAIRAIDPTDPQHKFRKPLKAVYGPEPIFNGPAIERQNSEGCVLFAVESQLCALSLEAVGKSAVACGGTGGIDRLIDALRSVNFKGAVAAVMDDDEAGRKASDQLRRTLEEELGITCLSFNCGDWNVKDPNEFFARDRGMFASAMNEFELEVHLSIDDYDERRRDALLNRMSSLGAVDSTKVAGDVLLGTNVEEPTPTGFTGLDDALGGGLRTGLYVLGATSSMGKTTACVQMGDHIASHGRPVLFVTVEQSAEEIVDKSISRLMSECGIAFPTQRLARTRDGWTAEERDRLAAACDRYVAGIAPNMHVMEPEGRPTAASIVEMCDLVTELHGESPVVIVDYLQLLAPESEKDDVRLATDKNVTKLRQLAKRRRCPVLVISNIKRDAYAGGIDMDSWKESGGIEYSADVLLGLQPYGIGDSKDAKAETRKNKALPVRSCEFVILKNRSGRTTDDGIPVTFNAPASRFTDGAAERRATTRKTL